VLLSIKGDMMSEQNAGDAPKLSAEQSPEEFRKGVDRILAERREFVLTCKSGTGKVDDDTAGFDKELGAAFDAVWVDSDADDPFMSLPWSLQMVLGLFEPKFVTVILVDPIDGNAQQRKGRIGRATQPFRDRDGILRLPGSDSLMQWYTPVMCDGKTLHDFARNFPKEMGLEEQLRSMTDDSPIDDSQSE
jgi:hypothetical protein